MPVDLRPVSCRREGCGRWFYLCRSCDRGHRYCSDSCRRQARKKTLLDARRKYARSWRGRLSNRIRQRRHRLRNPLQSRVSEETVTDHSSPGSLGVVCSVGNGSAAQQRFLVGDIPVAQNPMHSAHPCKTQAEAGFAPGSGERLSTQVVFARCHRCGRLGRVVNQGAPRGRFRWQRNQNRRT